MTRSGVRFPFAPPVRVLQLFGPQNGFNFWFLKMHLYRPPAISKTRRNLLIKIRTVDSHVTKSMMSQGQIMGAPVWVIVAMKKFIVNCWNFIFDHNTSPLRHIPDVAMRHYVLQLLGAMWAVSFSLAIGSYTFLAASVIGHTILIGAVAITVATYAAAASRPNLFKSGSGRRHDGEHE